MSEPVARTDEWTNCLLRVKSDRDAQQFAVLFGHFAPRVKSFLMKSGASETLADDALQEAMAVVWRKAHLFDPTKSSASTWIFTIVRNKQIDAIRKTRRPEPEEIYWENNPSPDAADVIETSQQEALLRKTVATLPDRQREIIEKAYFGELSHSEIAEVTGLPLGTIKSRIRLGLERLRHELSERA